MPNKTTNDRKERNKEIRRMVINLLYILLTIGVIIGFAVLDPNVKNFVNVLGSLNVAWVWGTVGILIAYWLVEAVLLKFIMHFVYDGPFSFWKSFKTSMIGVYYSALTPFSSGGQPMQVVHMRRDGVPAAKSSSGFCIKFITFEFVICGFFIINLLTEGTLFFADSPQVFYFTCFGFAINAVLAGVAILALVSKRRMVWFGTKMVHFLHKLHLVKNPEKSVLSLSNSLEDFSTSGRILWKNKTLFIGSTLITAVQMFAQFAITYAIYRAMGLNARSLWEVVSMQAYLYLTVSFVPLPGAAVASEGGFYLFFAAFFPSEMMFLAMLLWRIFTYYANIVFGSLFVLGDTVRSLLKRRGLAPQQVKSVGK